MPFDSPPPRIHALAIVSARGKRRSADVARFMLDVDRHAGALSRALVSGQYRPSVGRCFRIEDPKPRWIYALPFRDRVSQHLLIAQTLAVVGRGMAPQSYACRVGRGTHRCLRRAVELSRRRRFVLRAAGRRAEILREHRPDPAEPDPSTLHRLETLGARIEAVRHRIGHEAAHTLLYYLTNAFRHRTRLHAMILRPTSEETRRMYSSYHEELKAGAIAIMQEQILDEIREESRNAARIDARIELLVQLLDKRGLLDQSTRERIEHCRDQAQLQRWFDRAITATTAAAIFDAA